jgi:V8-like Glu-specific endopeptidase
MSKVSLVSFLLLASLIGCVDDVDDADALDGFGTSTGGVIVGGNDFVPVAADGSNVPARYRPLLNAFGRLTVGNMTCTATHIGNGVAVTAGHCFNAGSSGQTNRACPANTSVAWGRRAGTTVMTSTCTRILAMQDQKPYDYAFFEVDPIPPAAIPFWSSAGSVGNAVSTSGTVFSHPQGRDLEWSKTCYIPPLAIAFSHSCDTEPGSSGAAMIEDASLRIVGIHHSSDNISVNHGVYLNGTSLGWIWRAHRVDGTLRANHGLCLDTLDAGTADRTPFQLWSCHGASAQRFRRNGQAFTVGHTGKCLDSPFATVGTQPWQFSCWGGWNQQWQRANHELRNVSGKCVDVPYTHSGSQVWIFDCWGGTNQKWTITDRGEIRTPDGRCLDVPWSTTNGTSVLAVTCHGGANQRWTFNGNGEIRGLGGKCLDLANNNTANRTLFQLWDCNGTNAQKFHTRGDLRGPGNLCLEAAWGSGAGSRPYLSSCTGAGNQIWDHRW